MKEKKYNKECADGVIKSLGLDAKRIENCMGDPDADMENPVLKEEQDAQGIVVWHLNFTFNRAVWQFGSLAVWQFGSLVVWQLGNLVV